MAQKDIYVVIDTTGNAKQSLSDNYFTVLEEVATSIEQGASHGPRPAKLMRNGSIVIDSGLDALAYKFKSDLREARQMATDMILTKNTPTWLREALKT